MNIVLLVLLSGVCGSLIVAIPFILKYLCDISSSLNCVSHFLDKFSQDYDYYSCEFLSRFDESKSFDFDDKNEE